MSDIRKAIMDRLGAVVEGAKAAFAVDAGAVAKEILRQLGGGRFMSMVGGKNAFHGNFGGKPGLQVDIGKGAQGGINRLIVTLDPATDTYDMEFWRIANRGLSTKKVSEAHGVYADDLQRVFTDRTKFYTSMSRPGSKERMQKEYVLWGIPKGKTSALDEQVLSTQAKTPAQMDAIKKRAAADGWHSFRVQILDLSKPYKGFGFARPGAKAAFDRRIEVDHWTSPKGTKYVAGVHERGGGTSFQPFISATYSDGGEQLMTGNAPTFKTEKGARKWLDTEIGRRKSVSSRPGAKAEMGMRDTKGRGPFTLQYIASGLYGEPTWLLVDKANKVVAKEHNEQSAKEMLRKANAGEPVYVSSRPGAKSTNALYMIEIVEGGRVTSTITPDQFRNWAVRNIPGVSRNDFLPTMIEKSNEWMRKFDGSQVRIGGKSKNALSDACWQGYEAVGTKKQDGKTVPNCVPKATMGRAEQVMRDGSVHLDFKAAEEWLSGVTESALRYIIDDASKAAKAMPDGNKFNYYHDLSLTAQDELRKRQSKKSKATAAKPDDTEREDVKAGLKLMEKADKAVSDKIRTLIKEGKPQDQAVAIALDMKRRGEI